MSQVYRLHQLQQIDSEIRQDKKRLGEVLQAQKPGAELLAARESAAAAEAELKQWTRQQRDLELESQKVAAEAQQVEQRLYSGKVRNPKELADLQQKNESLKRRLATLEDQLLEVLIAREAAQERYQTVAERLAALEAAHARQVESLQAEQQTLAVRINELLAQRKAQVPAIPAAFLQKYETVMARQPDGVAVARIRGTTCMGCRVVVPANKIRSARNGELVYCDSCGRILVPA